MQKRDNRVTFGPQMKMKDTRLAFWSGDGQGMCLWQTFWKSGRTRSELVN